MTTDLTGSSYDTRDIPVTFAQEQLWFLDRLSPGETTYKVRFAFRLRGDLDPGVLKQALTTLVVRHEGLRTRFGSADGQPIQRIDPPTEAILSVSSLKDLAEPGRSAALDRVFREYEREPLDLEVGPLYRFYLVELGREEWVFYLSFHHAIADGWSAGILFQELSAIFSELLHGGSPALSTERMRYRDFAVQQRDRLDAAALETELQFWESYLRELPTLELPSARPRPTEAIHNGSTLRVPIPLEGVEAAQAYASAANVSLFAVLATAFATVLSRYTGLEDVPVGVTMLGRDDPDLEDIVGLFANMVVLCCDLSGDPSFDEAVERLADNLLDLLDHQEVPFEKVVERINPVRELGRNPLFQVAVQLLDDRTSGGNLRLEGVDVQPLDTSAEKARFDMTVNFVLSDKGLVADVEYSTDLFDEWWIEQLISHTARVVSHMCADPSSRISHVPLLSDEEEQRILAAGRGPGLATEAVPLHRWFDRVAVAQPEHPAAVCRDRSITYGDLRARSNQLARHLRDRGVSRGSIVAVAMDRDVDTLVAMLGALKAGAAFAMVDLTHPPQRIALLLEDTAAAAVVVREADAEQVPAASGGATVVIDREWPAIEALPATDTPEEWSSVDDAAYVVYTSGSTGKPKGVVVEHEAVCCFLEGYLQTSALAPTDRLLQLFAITFDMAHGEIFGALMSGATLVLVPDEDRLSPPAIGDLIRTAGITCAGLSPSWLSVIDAEPYPDLRWLMSGGEPLTAEMVDKWMVDGRQLVNMYGPTEAAISCTENVCSPQAPAPPIGHPQPGRVCYVVDRYDNLAPVGVPGELLIGGDTGLARGYLNSPELTAERFTEDPFRPGERVYRTGDLTRWTRSGELEFIGRIDRQVKVNGLRIELGEIEAGLNSHPGVGLATVLVPEAGAGKHLVAYLTFRLPGGSQVSDVQEHLRRIVPEYMVPSSWMVLDAMPLTPGGKIDRSALPAPQAASASAETDEALPSTATEVSVASIFAEVLERAPMPLHGNFFEMGGTSVQAMRVISRIKKTFNFKLSMKVFYSAPTVSAIAGVVDREAGAISAPVPAET